VELVAPVAPSPRMFRGDALVALSIVASKVGRSSETLKAWHKRYKVPVVIDPGGDWLGYQSWVDAVLGSALPGRAGNIAEVTRQWWAARGIELEEEEVA
jgi:hypothetical protein